MAQISSGFKDFDKNQPIFNAEFSLSEMSLIAKLLSHVRLGQDTVESKAAFSILEAIDTILDDVDVFCESDNSYLTVTAEDDQGMVVASITNDSAIFEFEPV